MNIRLVDYGALFGFIWHTFTSISTTQNWIPLVHNELIQLIADCFLICTPRTALLLYCAAKWIWHLNCANHNQPTRKWNLKCLLFFLVCCFANGATDDDAVAVTICWKQKLQSTNSKWKWKSIRCKIFTHGPNKYLVLYFVPFCFLLDMCNLFWEFAWNFSLDY